MSTFIDVARSYKNIKHQNEALMWLTDHIDDDLWQQFLSTWRRPAPQEPTKGIITPELMHRLTGYRADAFDATFCHSFNVMLKETGFDRVPEALAMLMANLQHESANFIYMKEISDGKYLDFRSDLGNDRPGDGPRYKGCGPLQVTGKTHFRHFYDWLKNERGIDDPRIIIEGTNYVADHYPFEIAIDWIQRNRLLEVCQTQGFDACCRKINGGTNGWADRHQKYQIAKKILT